MSQAAAVRPTHARYVVVAFAVALAVITYVDRVVISVATPSMLSDLHMSKVQMGYVFMTFAWTYGIFEIPWGWLGDRIGPRKILMRIVISWSIFTAATGAVWNHASLMITQGLFGAGEAGCFPNVAKAFTNWLMPLERVRAQGLLWLSARWGGAFTPILVTWMLNFMTWRVAFVVFAAGGVVWATLFYLWYRDHPHEHPRVNAAERELVPKPAAASTEAAGPVPWSRYFASRSFWLLCTQYFFLAYGIYFYLTWLPTYLIEARKVGLTEGALLAGLPLFFAGLGSFFCGFFLSRLAEWVGGAGRARRLLAGSGMLASSVFILVSTGIDDVVLAMLVLGLAGFSNDLAMPPSWGASMDLGGRHAGTLSACMNMMSCMGAAVSAWVTSHLLLWTNNNWNAVLAMSAGAYFIGALCWIFLDPVTPLDRKEAAACPEPSSVPKDSISARPDGATTS